MIGYIRSLAFRTLVLATVIGSITTLVLIHVHQANDKYFATVTQVVIADYFAEAKTLGVRPSIQDVLRNYCFHPNAHSKDKERRGDIACGAAVVKTFPTRLKIDQASTLLDTITAAAKQEGFSRIEVTSRATATGMIYEASGGPGDNCGLSVMFSNDDPAILNFPGYRADIQYDLMCTKISPAIPAHYYLVPD